MKKIFGVLAAMGIVMWSVTVFLRGTVLMSVYVARRILWVIPNFGTVWMGVGLTYIFFPYVFKKEFDEKYTYLLLGGIFALLFGSELIYHYFLGSSFDIWDMLASLAAGAIVMLIYMVKRRPNNKTRCHR